MTDLLCNWLNEEMKLERSVTKDSFEDSFSNGYLLGEILYKHGLQDDFDSFSKGKTSEAKLNNFTKLEPTLRLIEVPFDTNTIHDIIVSRKGAATRLLYQVFIALRKKQQNQLTSQTMEVMKPPAKAKLEKIQTEFFTQRLKQQVPRQVDLSFKELVDKFDEQRRKREEKILKQEQLEEEKMMEARRLACQQSLQKHRQLRANQAEMYKRLKPLELPTKDPRVTKSRSREANKRRKVAEETIKDIADFEKTHSLSSKGPIDMGSSEAFEVDFSPRGKKPSIGSSADYMSEIKARVKEDLTARQDRGMRRRKLLVDQMRLIQQKENEQREQILVDRLMRQSLQEKRIATQLMQIRKEKDNIRNNRIERQKQYEEERLRMFAEALDREAAIAACEKEEQKVMLKVQRERRKQLLLQRAREHYEKHYSMMMGIVREMVMLSAKIGQYRELTEGSIPDKLIRDWKLLFIKGKPLYDDDNLAESISSQGSTLIDEDGNDILDNKDLEEYLGVVNEWSPPLESNLDLPGQPNLVLTHIVHRLIDVVNPPQPLPPPPPFPNFQLKASFVGLPYTGKTSVLNRLCEGIGIAVLSPIELVKEVLDAYHQESAPSPEQEEQENDDTSSAKDPMSKERDKGDSIPPETQEEGGSEEPVKELSEAAKLGERVFNFVSAGESVDDETTVDIIVHEIRKLSDGSSWVLDNFPITLHQAQLLATALTGQGTSALKEQSDSAKKRGQDFLLIPKREVKEEELLNLSAACGLDLVIHFNVSVDVVLARSALYHKKMADPPDIQQHLLSFDVNWGGVEKWFQQFRVLMVIDANCDLTEVGDRAERIIMEKITKSRQMEKMRKHGITVEGTGLASQSFTKIANKHKPLKNEKSASITCIRRRRPSSAGYPPIWISGKSEDDPSARKRSVEEKLFEIMDPSHHPGSPEWIYIDNDINPELAHSLSERWPTAEKMYSMTFRGVFRQLRQERDNICHYVHSRRVEFLKYLTRPDNKQEFVTQWQKNYNEEKPHLRREDVMKAELHHRVDDLVDKLWDICEGRKKDAEQERMSIINDQWLLDKMGVVCNGYISLMNSELTKFQDTVLLLKDYYAAMQDSPIASLPNINERLPLIELPKAPKPGDSDSATSSQHSVKKTEEEEKQKEKAEEGIEKEQSETKKRVPLVPREPPVQNSLDDEKSKRKSTIELLVPPREDFSGLDLEEQLIVHAYNTAIAGIFKMFNSEIGIIEAASAEANKPPTPVAPAPEPKAEKSAGKGKKGAKSPAGKKGKATPKDKKAEPPPVATPTPVQSVSPEELAKKHQMELMRKEHMFALKHEERVVKARVQLIKMKALEFITYLRSHLSVLYQRMDDWIGECYQQEVKSVNQLSEVLRCAIENEAKLKCELLLPRVEFKINQGVLMYPPTPPLTPPPSREPAHPTQFSSLQLMALHQHLSSVAPDGEIMMTSLIRYIYKLVNKSFGENVFPLQWIGLSKDSVTQICHAIYGQKAQLVTWSRFIQCVSQPYPLKDKSVVEDLDTCVNYHLPDVTEFINRPGSAEPPCTPAPDN